MLAALAAVTSRSHVGHSMMNAPYRTPTHTAKIAATLDELSGGAEVGRDPATLGRSVDVGLDPRPLEGRPANDVLAEHLIGGTTEQIAERILEIRTLGIDSVRCLLWPEPDPHRRAELICALSDVVRDVHAA